MIVSWHDSVFVSSVKSVKSAVDYFLGCASARPSLSRSIQETCSVESLQQNKKSGGCNIEIALHFRQRFRPAFRGRGGSVELRPVQQGGGQSRSADFPVCRIAGFPACEP